MKPEALQLRSSPLRIQRFRANQGSGLRVAVPFAVLMLVLSLGCVITPLPRPGNFTPVPETPSPTSTLPSPTNQTVAPVLTVIPPSPTPVPTENPTPTFEPAPTRPTVESTQSPLPTSAPQGPFLQVFAPEEGATVLGNTVAVFGQTEPDSEVLVSGVRTEVDPEGGFRSSVSLSPGENVVEVVASNPEAGIRTVSRNVTSLSLPFLLLITEPENESIVFGSLLPISGRTGPNAIVSVNGRSVPVNRFGYFTSSLPLDEGPNVIDVVATNDDGQTLSKVLAVIYRRLIE